MRISEFHSGDLTEPCARKVQLWHEGKFVSEMPTAMYRGSVAGKALERLHVSGDWSVDGCTQAMIHAVGAVQDDLKAEKRTLTEAVITNRQEIHEDVARCVMDYAKRFGKRFAACKQIGCELPIRWTMERDDGEPIYFASHLDLLFRDVDGVWGKGEGRLIWWDWKWRQDAPSNEYLVRNHQFILYQLAVLHGQVMIDDDLWIDFGEWPACAWVHLPYLKPFGRATKALSDNGDVEHYAKGDTRPDRAIVRWAIFRRDRQDDMAGELLERVKMFEAGVFPMTPDPIGCQLCESRQWCPRFDLARLQSEEPQHEPARSS